jgi:carnitine 3-dehydrogenase
MSGKTSAGIAAERDQLLVQLLAAKSKTQVIP